MHIESLARVLPTPLDDTPATGQRDVLDFSHLNFNTPFDHMTASALPGLGWAGMNSGFEDLDWDSLFTFPEWPDTITQANSAPAILPNSLQTRSDPKESSWDLVEESPLREVDRVEAKCAEIQSYIRGSKTGVDLAVLSNYITRDRLVDCVELYTKGYQSVQPILHLPTFDLTKTPPDLLGAMMLVGACYSSTLIPATVVVQGAIHMLLVSEHSSHEMAMTAPPLTSIQANALLCQLLILTHNPQAYYFATMHRARTISMATRAGLFCPGDGSRHWDVDDTSFDWLLWSKSEMRTRLAHHIFVDDIGSNIFTRSPSHMSPFSFYVDTPCYNDCWVAPTARACLEKLRAAPPPIQLATAVSRLRLASSSQGPWLFDVSDCGMLEIVMALHSMLFRAMEESLDDENSLPQDGPASSTNASDTILSALLNRDLLDYDVANVADEIVGKYGSDAIRSVNHALNAWLANWNARRVHDMYHENHVAFTHPFNFWLLAKLFLVLHFFRNRYPISGIIQDGQPERDSELQGFYNPSSGTARDRLNTQVQVIGWLSMFRRQREGSLLSAGSFLSKVLNAH